MFRLPPVSLLRMPPVRRRGPVEGRAVWPTRTQRASWESQRKMPLYSLGLPAWMQFLLVLTSSISLTRLPLFSCLWRSCCHGDHVVMVIVLLW